MIRPARLAAACTAALLAVLLLAGPALAHITVNPREAPKGSFAKLSFRVPNERPDDGTVKVEVAFPEDHPVANVSVKQQPGWTYTVQRGEPATPLEAHGEQITEVVQRITWEGGPINPGEFDEFEVSVGPLPEDADELVFPALQTYASGEVVRWIELPTEGGERPEHPAPVLTLTEAGESHGGGDDTDTAKEETEATADVAQDDDEEAATDIEQDDDEDGAPIGLAVAGVVLGALGLLAGGAALLRGRST